MPGLMSCHTDQSILLSPSCCWNIWQFLYLGEPNLWIAYSEPFLFYHVITKILTTSEYKVSIFGSPMAVCVSVVIDQWQGRAECDQWAPVASVHQTLASPPCIINPPAPGHRLIDTPTPTHDLTLTVIISLANCKQSLKGTVVVKVYCDYKCWLLHGMWMFWAETAHYNQNGWTIKITTCCIGEEEWNLLEMMVMEITHKLWS